VRAGDLEVGVLAIKVVIEFQAKPGARGELKNLLESISATHGPSAPGFLGSTVYEALDRSDILVEIAGWETAEAQAAAVEAASTEGVYVPVLEVVAAPIRATRIGSPTGNQA
jgi:hypothetical protein